MRTARLAALAAALVALPVLSGGCFFTTEGSSTSTDVSPTEPAASATLIVKWTIAGLTDPNECTKSQSKNIEISVLDPDGSEVGAYQQTCTAFSTRISLRPGTYSATATLVDAEGRARTTSVSIASFTLRGSDSLTVPIDFPSNSFR